MLLLTSSLIINRHKNSVNVGNKNHNQVLLKLPEEIWNDDPCGCLPNQNVLWNTGELISDCYGSEKEAKIIYDYFPSRNRSDKDNMHKTKTSVGILITKYSKSDFRFWQTYTCLALETIKMNACSWIYFWTWTKPGPGEISSKCSREFPSALLALGRHKDPVPAQQPCSPSPCWPMAKATQPKFFPTWHWTDKSLKRVLDPVKRCHLKSLSLQLEQSLGLNISE